MTTKHTPGPWRVTQEWSSTKYTKSYGVEAPTPEGPGFPTPNATGFYAMALPPPHGGDPMSRAIQEANARLIAAAPDLLAVAYCIEDLGDELEAALIGDTLEEFQRVRAMHRAAIAKATTV